MELQIDTSTRYASVGLSVDGRSVVEIVWRSERNHSVELVPALNRALESAHAAISDLDAVFVARGPGGFSALRVGMSAAKAIAYTRAIPLVSVGTLDIELYALSGIGEPVCAIVGAGRNRLYTGMLDPGDESPKVGLSQTDDFLDGLSSGVIYCGEAVAEVSSDISARLGDAARIVREMPPTRHPSALADIGYRKLLAGDTASVETAEPLYLRSSQVDSAARRWGVRR